MNLQKRRETGRVTSMLEIKTITNMKGTMDKDLIKIICTTTIKRIIKEILIT